MAARTLIVALSFVSLALAGCIGGEEDGGVDTATTDEDGFNTTAPSGRTLVAFEETNKTEEGSGGVDHHHDHWNGRERVLIFETSAMMRPLGTGNAADYEAVATFRPPSDDPNNPSFIYEGTDRVEFTLSNPQRHYCEGEFTLSGRFVCTDSLQYHTRGQVPDIPPVADPTGGPSGLKLRYKHASTVNWIDAGEVAWGQPITIKINEPTETDMPHATSSAWSFQVVSPNTYDSTLTFDAKAEIIRAVGDDIPLWPGHPNFYVDSAYRKVVDSKQYTACDTAGCQLGESNGPVIPEKLISYGTRSLYIWVNITRTQFADPVTTPDNWFLFHVNSSGVTNSTNLFDKEDHPITKMEHYWILPVDDNGMDSPYADGSKWNFELGAAFFKEGLSCYGGCAAWSADYTITVIASNLTEPAENYEMFCIDRSDHCPQPEDGDDGGSAFVTRTPDGRVQHWIRRA